MMIRRLNQGEIDKIAAIDRAEHGATIYRARNGRPTPEHDRSMPADLTQAAAAR